MTISKAMFRHPTTKAALTIHSTASKAKWKAILKTCRDAGYEQVMTVDDVSDFQDGEDALATLQYFMPLS